MPIYTYECLSCSTSLERRQSFSDDPLTVHDECGGSLRRVIHPAGIVFKGSGFYNTDYGKKRKGAAPSDGSSSESKPSESKSSDAKSSSDSSSSSASSD